jgi:uncharacterized RDD family membrane protein YckC
VSTGIAIATQALAACPACGRVSGDGIGCQYCGQVRGFPDGVMLSSPARRLGEHVLELLLVVATLLVGWLVWAAIVFGRGQTPAKQLLGMKVVSLDQGRPLTWGMMFLRECIVKSLFTFVSSWLLYLPLLWIVWDKDRQELWDKAMGTIVVNDPAGALGDASFAIERPQPISAASMLAAAGAKTCPDCAEPVASEAKVCKHCGYRFRVCPDCAETVADAAKVCRHCGFRFADDAQTA